MNRALVTVTIVVLLTSGFVVLQPGAVRAQLPQPVYVIDKPTAGILPNGSYLLRGRAGPESSFLLGVYVGFREVIQIGASFGMQNVFDHGTPAVNDYPGFTVRARLLQETNIPALAIGFDSQGWGVYHEDLERYDRKSPGLYAVVSKNYALLLGELSLHGGISWSTERKFDRDPNVFGAGEWTVFERLSVLLGLDTALNDDAQIHSFGQGGVYLDAGVAWHAGETVRVSLVFSDLTGNFGPARGVGREFEFALIQSF
ncbi:MAG: hypothetical protein OEN01_04880 [Candidatus Krumholzibacteria bacterium]|nr:hypothetical protein [Candidatus Krumholzibacteria bacterium]